MVDTEGEDIEEGDFVVISNNEERAKEKQVDHGGWNPAMEKVGSSTADQQCLQAKVQLSPLNLILDFRPWEQQES